MMSDDHFIDLAYLCGHPVASPLGVQRCCCWFPQVDQSLHYEPELCLDWRCLKGGGDQCDSEVGRGVSSEVCGGVARYTDNQHWAGGREGGGTR